MEVELTTVCPACVCETWQVEVPDGLGEDELAHAARKALLDGDAELIDEKHGDEHDREVVRITMDGAPPTPIEAD